MKDFTLRHNSYQHQQSKQDQQDNNHQIIMQSTDTFIEIPSLYSDQPITDNELNNTSSNYRSQNNDSRNRIESVYSAHDDEIQEIDSNENEKYDQYQDAVQRDFSKQQASLYNRNLSSGQKIQLNSNCDVHLTDSDYSSSLIVQKTNYEQSRNNPLSQGSQSKQQYLTNGDQRGKSTNRSVNKSRRGRSLRKSRQSSRNAAQMSSIENKIMDNSCNEINSSENNLSTPAPENKTRKINPVLIQKALVSKSNQKIYDLADIIGDEQEDIPTNMVNTFYNQQKTGIIGAKTRNKNEIITGSTNYITEEQDFSEYPNQFNGQSGQHHQNLKNNKTDEQQIPPSQIIYNYQMKETQQSPFQKQTQNFIIKKDSEPLHGGIHQINHISQSAPISPDQNNSYNLAAYGTFSGNDGIYEKIKNSASKTVLKLDIEQQNLIKQQRALKNPQISLSNKGMKSSPFKSAQTAKNALQVSKFSLPMDSNPSSNMSMMASVPNEGVDGSMMFPQNHTQQRNTFLQNSNKSKKTGKNSEKYDQVCQLSNQKMIDINRHSQNIESPRFTEIIKVKSEPVSSLFKTQEDLRRRQSIIVNSSNKKSPNQTPNRSQKSKKSNKSGKKQKLMKSGKKNKRKNSDKLLSKLDCDNVVEYVESRDQNQFESSNKFPLSLEKYQMVENSTHLFGQQIREQLQDAGDVLKKSQISSQLLMKKILSTHTSDYNSEKNTITDGISQQFPTFTNPQKILFTQKTMSQAYDSEEFKIKSPEDLRQSRNERNKGKQSLNMFLSKKDMNEPVSGSTVVLNQPFDDNTDMESKFNKSVNVQGVYNDHNMSSNGSNKMAFSQYFQRQALRKSQTKVRDDKNSRSQNQSICSEKLFKNQSNKDSHIEAYETAKLVNMKNNSQLSSKFAYGSQSQTKNNNKVAIKRGSLGVGFRQHSQIDSSVKSRDINLSNTQSAVNLSSKKQSVHRNLQKLKPTSINFDESQNLKLTPILRTVQTTKNFVYGGNKIKEVIEQKESKQNQQKKVYQKSISVLTNSNQKKSLSRLRAKPDTSPKTDIRKSQSEVENYQTTQKITYQHFVVEESPRPTSEGSNESNEMDEFDKKIDIPTPQNGHTLEFKPTHMQSYNPDCAKTAPFFYESTQSNNDENQLRGLNETHQDSIQLNNISVDNPQLRQQKIQNESLIQKNMEPSQSSPDFCNKDTDIQNEIVEEKSNRMNTSTMSKNTRTLSGPQGYCPSSLKELLRPKLSSFRMSSDNNEMFKKEPLTSTLKKSETKNSELALEKKISYAKNERTPVNNSFNSKISKNVSRSFIKQKKSDFIQRNSDLKSTKHISNKNSSSKKNSISKRDKLNTSVLSDSRSGLTNQLISKGPLLKDEHKVSSQQKSYRNPSDSNGIQFGNNLGRSDSTRDQYIKFSSINKRSSIEQLRIKNKPSTLQSIEQMNQKNNNLYSEIIKKTNENKRLAQNGSVNRFQRNQNTLKSYGQVLKERGTSTRYTTQDQSKVRQPGSQNASMNRLQNGQQEQQKVQNIKEVKKDIDEIDILNDKQNNITERKCYYQLELQNNNSSPEAPSEEEEKSTNISKTDLTTMMNKQLVKGKKRQSIKRHTSKSIAKRNGTFYSMKSGALGDNDPYRNDSGRYQYEITQEDKINGQHLQSQDQLVKASKSPFNRNNLVTASVNEKDNTPRKQGRRDQQEIHQSRTTTTSTSIKLSNNVNSDQLEQQIEMQKQQNMKNQIMKNKKQSVQNQNMERNQMMDQMIYTNTGSQQSNRSKYQNGGLQKMKTTPIASSMQTSSNLYNPSIMSLPPHMQERIMKEQVMNPKGSDKYQNHSTLEQEQSMQYKIIATSSYKTNENAVGQPYSAKSNQKKGARMDASLGPSSKYKTSSNLGPKYLVSANQRSSVQHNQRNSQYGTNTKMSHGQSVVRQAQNQSMQKTPITAMIGGQVLRNKPSTFDTSANAIQGGPPKEKKQSFAALLQPYEKEKFGDRNPAGFRKLGLLGKGGIAMVWHGEIRDCAKYGYSKDMEGMKVALKQFPKQKGQPFDNSAKIEIENGNTLFPLELKDDCDGENDEDFYRGYAVDKTEHPGIMSIARLIDQIEDSKDVWLVYEVGGIPLGKALCDVKGEFYKGERIYKVQHMEFYENLIRSKNILRTFIVKIAEAFDVLSRFGIVHSDIKPDNILIEMNRTNTDIERIKLIDFGSAFQFHNVTQITATTPEYLAPEILNYLEERNKNSKANVNVAVALSKKCWPWSFDVWSLGIILLEVITGFPIWMSLKSRVVTVDGRSLLGNGLLGVAQRDQKKIILKQQQIFKSIPNTLKKFECYGLDRDPYFMDLLHRMLCQDPSKRISPVEIVNHPFCQQRD